jgi:regulator of protease activity HflC (stomatin/prohibitin superfamily)
MKLSVLKILSVVLVSIFVSGCDAGIRQMGATEYGVVFRNLPRFLGGGLASNVHEPGSLVVVWPWEEMYRIDTSVKELSWGFNTKPPSYISSRALDGNEVALAVSLRYQVKTDVNNLPKLVHEVGYSPDAIEYLVKSVATADIRLFMNELHTSEFLKTDSRYRAVDKVRQSLLDKLSKFNIEVVSVNLDDFRFERTLDDGKIDASYQDKLNETQRIREEIEREKARVDTVVAQKQQEFNDVQAKVNRQIAEADGYKKQATSRGDSYLQARTNEAESVLAVGRAEAQGLQEKVQALSGSGGRALLKLDIAKSLMSSNPKFFVLGSDANSLDVRRTDTNSLLEQAGIFEALRTSNTITKTGNPVVNESTQKDSTKKDELTK